MFSTNEGVNEFLSWLENESGYSAQEKKTVLQKLADWILEIIDAVQELIQGESLNKVVTEFAKEETARLKEIRKMFLEALDEVSEGTVGRETKNTAEGGVKLSLSEMGFDEFSRETANNIKMRQGVIINSVSDLEEHIKNALKRNKKINLYVGAISEEVKKKIENDIETKIFKDKQYAFVVSYDDIIHIAEHFGENVKDIAREVIKLYDIIKHYDTVDLEITSKGVKTYI